MKYYMEEHLQGYQQIVDMGISSWDELHGSHSFEDAAIRHYLSIALPHCSWEKVSRRVLEYGCGTGPGACYLAEQGFQVAGIDLNPMAIAIARQEAAKRKLKIEYATGDICAWQGVALGNYDLIVDAFCLQSIVTDADRAAILQFVRSHLATNGYYLICTAGFSPTRHYDGVHFDPQSGIVYVPLDAVCDMEDVTEIDDKLYRPYRRHLRVAELIREVGTFDFRVSWQQVDTRGNIALLCVL